MNPTQKPETEEHPSCKAQSDRMEREGAAVLKRVDQLYAGGALFPMFTVLIFAQQCELKPEERTHTMSLSDMHGHRLGRRYIESVIDDMKTVIADLEEDLAKLGKPG